MTLSYVTLWYSILRSYSLAVKLLANYVSGYFKSIFHVLLCHPQPFNGAYFRSPVR